MTRLPLYKDADAEHKRDDPKAGLLFERFFDKYNTNALRNLQDKLAAWLKKFANHEEI